MIVHEQLTETIIGAAIDVHRELGPGLLESAYEECMCVELQTRDVPFIRQVAVPLKYKGVSVECGYRADLIVDEKVVVELKSIEKLLPIHTAQLMTYMKLTSMPIGLLMNFNNPVLKDGIVRRVL